MFKRILVANRGEIAVRVIRACREMGIESVAVYSDVDRRALHLRKADLCEYLGPAQASESYLNIPKILEAARRSQAEAIHPGYGFLSESADFARACCKAGFVFIGPSPESMEMMGSKTRARQNMRKANVPLVPGTDCGLKSAAEAVAVAESIGYPVMLKAAAGGGGKGMRLVTNSRELAAALDATQSEAQRSFGDSEVYIEKFIENPRHVEMQIFGDTQGNVIYLAERECSVQRRHQKVLEEAPCLFVDPDMRRRMGDVSVNVGKAANYYNAGTVEFLVDANKNFYFLEMNTRLQVEHPVTEMITGIDLVQLQIRVAAGEPLPYKQKDVVLRGHAMELRVYAEDPDNNFFPSPGRITRLISPSGPGIRRDSGMYEGWVVPLDYDPLLAKLIAYGEDRTQVINRLRRALVEYFIGGIKTNISLFRRILLHPDFQAGRIDTGFLDRLLKEPPVGDQRTARRLPIVALAAAIFAQQPPPGSQPARTQDGLHAATPHHHPAAPNNGVRPSGWKAAARTEGVGR
jgi:acetyl-CoA carboxylase biotin carboxylase subunit